MAAHDTYNGASPMGSAPNRERTRRILIVEDEPVLRAMVSRALRLSGYHTLVAGDGIEALALLEREAGLIDLIVTDIVMPRMSGIGLYRAARRRSNHVPFLFTSAGGFDEADGHLSVDVSGRYLPKPWTLEELVSMVQQMLGPD